MKRIAGIIVFCAFFTGTAFAKDFTNLIPPSIAVVDFEVSMASDAYYGQLISQALLSVLVQQNGNNNANLLDGYNVEANPNIPLYTPGGQIETASPIKSSVAGASRFVAPIFRIFDKKYVEKALIGANYTVNDLYTKSTGAFSFTDLDFMVLGNVSRTKYLVGKEMWDCIGFNVRVLNTARAEELFSYTAIVRSDLADLQAACTTIARMLMQDVLSRYCAQFFVANTTESNSDSFRLFWQPQQDLKDDDTLITTDDTWKKEIVLDQYYWVLPGTYLISVYSNDSQLLQNVGGPLVLKPGDIQQVKVLPIHLAPMKGSLTIKVPASDTIEVFVEEIITHNQNYWWEVGSEPKKPGVNQIAFSADKGAQVMDGNLEAEYVTQSNDLVLSDLPTGKYLVRITKLPNEELASVFGWRRIVTSKTIYYDDQSIEIKSGTPARLDLSKITNRTKKAGVNTTRVTFVFNPGFYTWLTLHISSDPNFKSSEQYSLVDREKVTVDVEYSQAEWDAQPTVYYYLSSRLPVDGESNLSKMFSFNKADLDPSQDKVVVVDWRTMAKVQKDKREPPKPKPAPAPVVAPVYTAPIAATVPVVPIISSTPPATAKETKLKMAIGTGIGVAIQTRSITPTSSSSSELPAEESLTGLDFNASTSIHYFVNQSMGIGVGGMVHGLPENTDGIYSQLGGILSANVIFGNPFTGGALTWLELGFGSGTYLGLGHASPSKPGKNSHLALHLGILFNEISESNSLIYNYENYPARQTSIQLGLGLLF